MNRTYDSPAIEDLYRLHEMFHAAFMPYFPGIGFDAFHRKMEDNELGGQRVFGDQGVFRTAALARDRLSASNMSQTVYLGNSSMQTLWRENKPVAIETLQEARRDVMFSKREHEMDLTERWIRRFALQNRQWSTCWYNRSGEIEQHMFEFQIRALQGDRSGAMQQHAAWIKAEASPAWGRSHPLSSGSGIVREYLLERPTQH